MTYKFKNGDSGKTRGGYPYKVVAELDRADEDKLAVILQMGGEDQLYAMGQSGRYYGRTDHDYDLIPPKQNFLVVVFYNRASCTLESAVLSPNFVGETFNFHKILHRYNIEISPDEMR